MSGRPCGTGQCPSFKTGQALKSCTTRISSWDRSTNRFLFPYNSTHKMQASDTCWDLHKAGISQYNNLSQLFALCRFHDPRHNCAIDETESLQGKLIAACERPLTVAFAIASSCRVCSAERASIHPNVSPTQVAWSDSSNIMRFCKCSRSVRSRSGCLSFLVL